MIAENEYMKTKYGFEYKDPCVIEECQKLTVPKYCIQGAAWYDILNNLDYQNRF